MSAEVNKELHFQKPDSGADLGNEKGGGGGGSSAACVVATPIFPLINCTPYVTRFGKTSNNAIEHVFMYKLIKINIPINMYTEVIFTTPISLQWKGA